MQFDKDLNSPHAKLFLDIRKCILKQICDGAKEKYSPNITSISSSFGGICYLKTTQTGVHIGWFKGVNIKDLHNFLFGKGKIIRGQSITKLDKNTKNAIADYIKQTQNFLIEHRKLRKTPESPYCRTLV
jgi:hypothetical protein